MLLSLLAAQRSLVPHGGHGATRLPSQCRPCWACAVNEPLHDSPAVQHPNMLPDFTLDDILSGLTSPAARPPPAPAVTTPESRRAVRDRLKRLTGSSAARQAAELQPGVQQSSQEQTAVAPTDLLAPNVHINLESSQEQHGAPLPIPAVAPKRSRRRSEKLATPGSQEPASTILDNAPLLPPQLGPQGDAAPSTPLPAQHPSPTQQALLPKGPVQQHQARDPQHAEHAETTQLDWQTTVLQTKHRRRSRLFGLLRGSVQVRVH